MGRGGKELRKVPEGARRHRAADRKDEIPLRIAVGESTECPECGRTHQWEEGKVGFSD